MEKPWLKHYESHVPHEIEPKFENLIALMENAFEKYKDRQAFACMGKSLTFRDMDKLSKEMAAYLQTVLGLQKGDRVAIMMPNILQYPIALLGALRAGLVVVNVNPLYTARELEHQLNDSQSTAIIIVENFAHVLQEVISNTQVKKVVVTGLGDQLGLLKGNLVNFVVRHVKKMVPPWQLPGAVTFNRALAEGSVETLRKPAVRADDLAFLQYTGGTTGVSKGAMLSHRNMTTNIAQASVWIEELLQAPDNIIMTPLPLYHIFSLTANLFTFMNAGALGVLITNPRDLDGFIKEMKNYPFTAFTGVNTLFNGLVNHPGFREVDFSSLRVTLGGGMAVTKTVADQWKAITGCTLTQAYGLTETSPAATINPFNIESFNGSIGLPISSTEVSIRSDEGAGVSPGDAGEIWIRGPQVMQGYWKREEETRKVITEDGWFKSGDIGVMDHDGFITIVDRKKDMILVSGFNVYPNEIDDVVSGHPGILEAAAVGVPDEKSGEAVKLYVVKKDDNLTEDSVIAYCRDNLTGYKVPKHVEFREDLPKTNVGKILRRELRSDAG